MYIGTVVVYSLEPDLVDKYKISTCQYICMYKYYVYMIYIFL